MNITQLYPKLDQQAFSDILDYCLENSGMENLTKSVLEKDAFLTGVLCSILANSSLKENIFFKGGTALSKCFRITGRFSEDCDLFVGSNEIVSSRNRESTINKKVFHEILERFEKDVAHDEKGEHLGKLTGDYKSVSLNYDILNPNEFHKPLLKFEISSCALRNKESYEVESFEKKISPMFVEILARNNQQSLLEELELHSFKINCISPIKTLAEKISRINRISYYKEPIDGICKYIRDFYDITMLLKSAKINKLINGKEFFKALYYTKKEDLLRTIQNADKDYHNACIIANPAKYLNVSKVRNEYENMINAFVFNPSQSPSLQDLIDSIKTLFPILKNFDKSLEPS